MPVLTSLPAAPWHEGGEAVVAGAVRWDYAELAIRSQRRAEHLSSQGLSAGEVVLAPDAPALDLFLMQHALDRLGCGLLPVSSLGNEARVEALIRAAGVEWSWHPGLDVLVPTDVPRTPPKVARPPPALVVETSGSSSAPKAAMLTAENVLSSAHLVNARLGLRQGDRWLSCLPRNHVGGLMIAYRCALTGASVLLHEGFDASAVRRDLVRQRVTHISLVPPMLARLLAIEEAPPTSLRVLLVGGQSLSGALARRAIDAGWPLRVTYGMTETTSQVATSPVLSAVPRTGFAGGLLPGIEVRCDATPAAPGQIRIRGPVVMAGYANPERRPGDGVADGWLATNDIGFLLETGELAVIGRTDEVLVIGGEAVFPSRVEDRMTSAPGVDSVVVVGLEDPVWGHRLVAAYSGAIGSDALDRWCRQNLTRRERPGTCRRMGQLPLLDSGKPDRRRIQEMITVSADSDIPGTPAERMR